MLIVGWLLEWLIYWLIDLGKALEDMDLEELDELEDEEEEKILLQIRYLLIHLIWRVCKAYRKPPLTQIPFVYDCIYSGSY